MMKQPLDSDGIYYKHDETNMLKGYAYICGPEDSVYFGGNYFFEFNFPSDYPHSPPKVEFKTNDGVTRFHPNMYRSGKMCLSILNTWRGDQWTGCQSIRTILLTIISVMDSTPLLHEPGFSKTHSQTPIYSEFIKYKNIDFAINTILSPIKKTVIMPFTDIFKEEMVCEFTKNKTKILAILEDLKDTKPKTLRMGVYSQTLHLDWKKTHQSFLQLLDDPPTLQS
jgi:ubiquitin-conjugating enzyme E2 Z